MKNVRQSAGRKAPCPVGKTESDTVTGGGIRDRIAVEKDDRRTDRGGRKMEIAPYLEQRLLEQYGAEETENIRRGFSAARCTTLRTNRLKGTPEETLG